MNRLALLLIPALFLTFACNDDGSGDTDTLAATETNTGDGDGDPTGTEDPTGDGDPTGSEDPTGEPDGGFCAHQCSGDADCLIGGDNVGLTCVDSFCTGESSSCTGDAECVALFSGWTTACTSGGGECDGLGQLCIAVDGGGACATPPSDFFMCDAVPGWAALDIPDIDGNTVTVCGNPSAECNDAGYCFDPCESDADCPSEAYPICNTGTGICGCGTDDHCATIGQPGLSVCNAGTCGCGTDQNCIDQGSGDVCTTDGFCGCTGDGACAGVDNSFDGGTIECVGL